jgi:hypothetical protein
MKVLVITTDDGVIEAVCAFFLPRRGRQVRVSSRHYLGAASGATVAAVEDIVLSALTVGKKHTRIPHLVMSL